VVATHHLRNRHLSNVVKYPSTVPTTALYDPQYFPPTLSSPYTTHGGPLAPLICPQTMIRRSNRRRRSSLGRRRVVSRGGAPAAYHGSGVGSATAWGASRCGGSGSGRLRTFSAGLSLISGLSGGRQRRLAEEQRRGTGAEEQQPRPARPHHPRRGVDLRCCCTGRQAEKAEQRAGPVVPWLQSLRQCSGAASSAWPSYASVAASPPPPPAPTPPSPLAVQPAPSSNAAVTTGRLARHRATPRIRRSLPTCCILRWAGRARAGGGRGKLVFFNSGVHVEDILRWAGRARAGGGRGPAPPHPAYPCFRRATVDSPAAALDRTHTATIAAGEAGKSPQTGFPASSNAAPTSLLLRAGGQGGRPELRWAPLQSYSPATSLPAHPVLRSMALLLHPPRSHCPSSVLECSDSSSIFCYFFDLFLIHFFVPRRSRGSMEPCLISR
jgi:hypothetical protein